MENLKIQFGKRIKLIRQKRKLSQEELAEKIEIAVTNMGKIERGESFVTASTLEKLSSALSVKVQDFFAFDDYTSVQEMKKELDVERMSDAEIKKLYKYYKNFVV